MAHLLFCAGRRMAWLLPVWIFATFVAPTAHGARKLLAVLEFRGKDIRPEILMTMSDAARSGALAVSNRGYDLITRESMDVMLKDMGGNLKCEAGECEVETGRNIGADYVVTGEIVLLEGTYLATLKFFETAKGTLLATRRAEGKGQLAVIKSLEGTAQEMIERGLGIGKRPSSAGGPGQGNFQEGKIGGESQEFSPTDTDQVVVSFESTPAGAVVLLDGALICQTTPCRKAVALGEHEVSMQKERYQSATSRPTLGRGSKIVLTLNPTFGWLAIETQPPGVALAINGKPEEGGHTQAREVAPGGYEVVVVDPCYEPMGERVLVKKGEQRRVVLAAKPRTAAVRVTAEDDKGNALEGEVWVDDARLGQTPKTYRVPLCARQIEVRAAGKKWSGRLALKEREVKEVKATFARELGESEVRSLVKNFYETKGEWAGQYMIQSFEQVRLVRQGDTDYQAHVRYAFKCLLRSCSGGASGYDQRIFFLKAASGGTWQVQKMGGYMSAQF